MTMNPKVLLVDDDADFLFQQRTNLARLNFNVIEASTVKEALTAMEQQKPDIAIIDLMMEEMDDGFVLAHHLKKANPTMPVIMTTAVTSVTGYQFDGVTSGDDFIKADVILPKPLRFEQLRAEMKKLGY